MPSGKRGRFSKRFVLISEVLGYFISFCVFAFVIYSVFVEVKVITKVTGEITYEVTTVSSGEDIFLCAFVVESGAWIAAGSPVCEIIRGTPAIKRAKARAALRAAIAEINDSFAGLQRSVELLKQVLQELESLSQNDSLERLCSSSEGFFLAAERVSDGDYIRQGSPLFHTINPSRFTFTGRAGNDLAAKIQVGQPFSVVLPELGRLVGTVDVAKVEGNDLVIRASLAPDIPHSVSGEKNPIALLNFKQTAEGQIVTGNRTLFAEVFGRRN